MLRSVFPLLLSYRKAALKGIYDFDHPNALDNELMLQMLKEILQNKIVRLPVYDFKTHSRSIFVRHDLRFTGLPKH